MLLEMFVVGAALVVFSLIVEYIGNTIRGKKTRWPPNPEMIRGVFVTGALFHFVFELTGLNELYAKNYKPLLKGKGTVKFEDEDYRKEYEKGDPNRIGGLNKQQMLDCFAATEGLPSYIRINNCMNRPAFDSKEAFKMLGEWERKRGDIR